MKYLIKPPSVAVTSSMLRLRFIPCIAVALLAATQSVVAQFSPAAPHTGLVNTAGAAFNPVTGKGYIVDSSAGIVHIANDHDGTVRSVEVGAHPTSIAVDTENGRAYVANAGDGTVTVIGGQD